mmetsp:Transcript_78523/g.220166  ORF Transcript_78523/g.220166 Transcript_78523/m.220166 type:complete len:196 (+) Transcript_78523:126-713(+)
MPPRRRLVGGIALVACLLSLTASDGDVPSDEDACATAASGTSAADAFAACATAGLDYYHPDLVGRGAREVRQTLVQGGGERGLGQSPKIQTGASLNPQETSFAQWVQKQWPKVKRIKSILMSAEPETQGEDTVTTWPLVWGVVVIVIGAWMIGVCCVRRSASFESTLEPMGQSNPSALATAGSRSHRQPCADACM